MNIFGKSNAQIWISAPGEAFFIKEEMALIRTESGQTYPVTDNELLIWKLFYESQTIPQAALTLSNEYGWAPAEIQLLEYSLKNLEKMGLIFNKDSLRTFYKSRTSTTLLKPPRLETLVIPTCRRPAGLARSLEAWSHYVKKVGREIKCVVGDDSDPVSAKANSEVLTQYQDQFASLDYLNRDKRFTFAKELSAHTGINLNTCTFALLGSEGFYSAGANRNSLMLTQVNQTYLSVDDDVLPMFHGEPSDEKKLRFERYPNLEEFSFYPDRASLLRAHPLTDAYDIFKSLENVLGKSVEDFISSCSEALDLTLTSEKALGSCLGADAKIRLAMLGLIGNDFILTPRILNPLLSSLNKNEIQLPSRELIKLIRGNHLSAAHNMTGPVIGYDTQSILPPFIPCLRGEDSLFGVLSFLTDKKTLSVTLPWACYHDPVDARPNYSGFKEEIARWNPWAGSGNYLRFALSYVRESSAFSAPYSTVGNSLISLASLPLEEYQKEIEPVFLRALSDTYQLMLCKLEENGIGSKRQELIEYALARLEHLALNSDSWLPDEVKRVKGEATLAWTQDTLRKVGEVLIAWPALWEEAKQLRKSGWTQDLLENP